MKRFSALIACAVFWTGCVNATPEAAEADRAFESYKATLPEPNADYGSYPKQYQKLIKSYMNETLKDPESAKYSGFSKPRKEHAIENRKAIYGYASCVLVNAKNSYGGYTGNQQFWFFYRNDKIVRVQNVSTGVDIIYMGHPINCENG